MFIHGFTGHPARTWTHRKGGGATQSHDDVSGDGIAKLPSKIRRLNPFGAPSSNVGESNGSVYWPRDLLPIVDPTSRIMTYGYDSHIRHWMGAPVSRNTVYDIAWDLLVALESARRSQPSRPVLFVAHSLGGIVVKEMLRRSKGCQLGQAYLHTVFQSTIGIIFFGTPHAGTEPRGFLQHVAENVIKVAGFSANDQIISSLLPTAERLRELRDEFGPMAQQQSWIIHSFQEQYGIKLLSGNKVRQRRAPPRLY